MSNNRQETPNRVERPGNLLSTNTSILSKLSFVWAYPTLKLGSMRPLEEIDLPKTDERIFSREYSWERLEETGAVLK